MTTELIKELLEQHGHYDLPGGFSLSKTSKIGWCLYWRCKHVDLHWRAKHNLPEPKDDELTSYKTAFEAISDLDRVRWMLK